GGMHFWRTGSFKPLLDKGTMPLPAFVTTVPVRAWEKIRGYPMEFTPKQVTFALHLPRPATLHFWWLLLVYAFLAASRIGGAWAGRLAVAFTASEPNLLAHASLATTDIAICACLLVFAVHFHAGREGNWWWRVGLPALLYAVALLAKASALVFG